MSYSTYTSNMYTTNWHLNAQVYYKRLWGVYTIFHSRQNYKRAVPAIILFTAIDWNHAPWSIQCKQGGSMLLVDYGCQTGDPFHLDEKRDELFIQSSFEKSSLLSNVISLQLADKGQSSNYHTARQSVHDWIQSWCWCIRGIWHPWNSCSGIGRGAEACTFAFQTLQKDAIGLDRS